MTIEHHVSLSEIMFSIVMAKVGKCPAIQIHSLDFLSGLAEIGG